MKMEENNSDSAMSSSQNDSEEFLKNRTFQKDTIQAIDRKSVHHICSGQVIVNLATGVKELVENSIDAGATTVEIKLKEYGSELIEVIDNGCGVAEENFEGLTLKHYTSKLKDISDLTLVETFGFRGEALSSLCALSKLTIITRHINASVGTKLQFDHHGKINSCTPCARQPGCTVILENLFSTLPVRHKEFLRNLKKEFFKMVQVLNSYCLINVGVRISCYNQVGKGSRSLIVSSIGKCSVKENIANIFGTKQLQTISEIIHTKPSEDVCAEFGIKLNEEVCDLFSIDGYISKCEHGCGRSSTDRQFYFVNKRPCDSVKITKIVNDVYHMYNRHQYPFVVLQLNITKGSVDVNVTPDKRKVFFENEKLLHAIIKASLLALYEPTSAICTSISMKGQLSFDTKHEREFNESCEKELSSPKQTPSKLLSNLTRSMSSPSSGLNHHSHENTPSSLMKFYNEKQKLSSSTPTLKKAQSLNSLSRWLKRKPQDDNENVESDGSSPKKLTYSEPFLDSSFTFKDISQGEHCKQVQNEDTASFHSSNETEPVSDSGLSLSQPESSQSQTESHSSLSVYYHSSSPEGHTASVKSEESQSQASELQEQETEREMVTKSEVITKYDEESEIFRKETTVPFSMDSLRQKLKLHREHKVNTSKDLCRNFRAKISPSENKSAEEELAKQIDKSMFKSMEILGQFNLGFIITRLNEDLFIVDQHATDEKYNFEKLRKNTVMQGQKLIRPQPLELTASNEIILLNSIEIFNRNGFSFIIDESAVPGQRVKLETAPVSKNWNFGKEDIEELIFMLTDFPGVMCRPSRICQMFASRACRKSIMIGTALKKREMKTLICHMSELDQPWNCPHGRPTMRHLINLNMIPTSI
ncbi:mismatch repair endonuclease PMS2 [Octopus bimaculoides]|uniref:Mismatch repair endonuclease PMS2 n=1 Tax=Octopus bimaculoides TaxID=37653 RepID=A0A0L8HZE7_OCTBM|nr:mismatch repair endonuclease PMS2 [Octopus bimaculoides]XP_014768075.1 mismatch repair endonuclease PMS2 [Octopus bimaculoides]|eukprot:XP_014768074.1 PREDICTED: mismatch repair endonuclease PMS2-like [Octopus bimaculoides]